MTTPWPTLSVAADCSSMGYPVGLCLVEGHGEWKRGWILVVVTFQLDANARADT